MRTILFLISQYKCKSDGYCFHDECEKFFTYDDAIDRGDPIAIETTYPSLYELFFATNKDNYTCTSIFCVV